MRKAYGWVKEWIRNRLAIFRVKRVSNEIIIWISHNPQANMSDFTDMMGGHGYYITGFSIAGDEVVYANSIGYQINVKLGVGTDEEDGS